MSKTADMPSMKSVDAFRRKLENKETVFGPFMITSDPAFVETAGHAGYDFVLLDMEHGPGTFESLQNLIRAANVTGVMPVVRVPRGTDIWIDKALDVGAGAVLVPQINTAQQARDVVAAAKFAPAGCRGTCRFVRSAGYGALSGAEYFNRAQDTAVIIQAEGKAAIENLDEILDVRGIDIVFIGPYDLSSSLGLIGQVEHPAVVSRIKNIVRKASEKNIKIGCFADTAERGRELCDMGISFIGYSCDTAIFYEAAKHDIAIFRGQE